VVCDVDHAADGAQLFGEHFLVYEVVFNEENVVVCDNLGLFWGGEGVGNCVGFEEACVFGAD
jgi:hypothetical protein